LDKVDGIFKEFPSLQDNPIFRQLLYFVAYKPARFFPGSFAVDRVPNNVKDWDGGTLSKDDKPVHIWITGTVSSYEKQGNDDRVSIEPYDKSVLFHAKKLLKRDGQPAPDVFSSEDTITMAGSMASIFIAVTKGDTKIGYINISDTGVAKGDLVLVQALLSRTLQETEYGISFEPLRIIQLAKGVDALPKPIVNSPKPASSRGVYKPEQPEKPKGCFAALLMLRHGLFSNLLASYSPMPSKCI